MDDNLELIFALCPYCRTLERRGLDKALERMARAHVLNGNQLADTVILTAIRYLQSLETGALGRCSAHTLVSKPLG